jgi:hypothetical protein
MVLKCVCCAAPAVVNVARAGDSAWFCTDCAGKVVRLPKPKPLPAADASKG